MTTRLRASVLAAKDRLAQGYQRLKARHDQGAPGAEVCADLTDLRDAVVMGLLQAALEDLNEEGPQGVMNHVALVALGGYGRRDVAPFSDVDLMILHTPDVQARAAAVAQRILRDVFDAGLTLGQSLCTPRQACQLALDDAQVCTSFVEARLLTGNQDLMDEFLRLLRRQLRGRRQTLLAAIQKARFEERHRFGETVFLLEPNLKRSNGALRDIQFIRWVGFVRYGEREPEKLCSMGLLSPEDCVGLERANEFLLHLRNELHFHAGKPGDVLDRGEQLRIANSKGYPELDGLLPVEQFMREYFRHTCEVSHVSAQFLRKARTNELLQAWVTSLFGHRAQDHLRVGPAGILATRRGRERMRGNLREIMRLVDLANLYDKQIAPSTWDVVRREAPHLPPVPDDGARRHFLSLLSHAARLGPLLRDLHEIGLLERFVPAFTHARGLLQFNQYHKYTVDEHCIRAVVALTALGMHAGALGRAYRWIGRKRVLHLAMLIHDLGKGLPVDHVIVGQQIALDTAQRLGLSPLDAETLRFLVEKHQVMGTLALRRDTSDPDLVLRFAVEVGSPEVLAMLFVMTAADYTAVGPDTWDDWKEEILCDLYFRAMEHLAGDGAAAALSEQLEQHRQSIGVWLGAKLNDPWYQQQLASLPAPYLSSTLPRQIAEDLHLLQSLPPKGVVANGQFLPETGAVQFTVAASEDIVPGIFHRLTGALTSHGLQILSAQINTLADGLIIDRFWVTDPDYTGQPPQERIAQVSQGLAEVLRSPSGQPPTFRRTWHIGQKPDALAHAQQTRVNFDNSSSDRYTILDIFTHDRAGLLYTITRKLFELGLSVYRAKIATHLDQVVDVFYVTDGDGRKIEDDLRLVSIRQDLLEVIEEMGNS